MICAHCIKYRYENKEEPHYRVRAKRIERPFIWIDKKLCCVCTETINHDYEYDEESIRVWDLKSGKRLIWD